MKRFLLPWFSALFYYSHAATITWDGGGTDGQWSTAANWAGNILPGPSDDVLLNNALLPGSYTITLPAGAVSITINSLTITPSGSNSITVILPVTNTSPTALQINGSGDAFLLNNNAVFINSSGASSGTPVSVTATNFFRINNGGHYIHNTQRAHTDNLAARLSSAAGTENGTFEFDVPSSSSYFISASGRTYGNLVFSGAASGGTITYAASGLSALTMKGNLQLISLGAFTFAISNNIFVTGNLTVENGCRLNISSNTNNTILYVKGNLSVAGILTETGTAMPAVELNGSSVQTISAAGSIINYIDFRINNASGASLVSNILLPYQLTLVTGKISTGSHILSTPVISGASASNYIVTGTNGFLEIRNVLLPVVFPIGPTSSSYNPVSVSGGMTGSLSVRAEEGINPAIANPFASMVNRTWIFSTIEEPGAMNTSFQFNGSHGINGFSTTAPAEIGINVGGPWSVVAGGLTVTGSNPYVVTRTLTNFNARYIIGNNGAILPIDFFITCQAQKNKEDALIRWTIGDEEGIHNFELQRSVNGNAFQTIATVSPIHRQLQYSYTDALLAAGTNFYRIKMNRSSGLVTYSNTVAVSNNSTVFIHTVVPNPVVDAATITIHAARAAAINFILFDMNGRTVKQWRQPVPSGNSTFHVLMSNLPAGIYHLCAGTDQEFTTSTSILKQ